MRNAEYLELEKKIARADVAGIAERWRYGRRLLVDDSATTPNGHFRHRVIAELIQRASAAGLRLSERELQRRLECGRTYETEAEIQEILARFEDWTALRDAGFPTPNPPVGADLGSSNERDEDEPRSEDDATFGEAADNDRPYDPRTTAELERDMRNREQRLRNSVIQQTLFEPEEPDAFPRDRYGPDSTLAELRKYAEECREWTDRQARADDRRERYLKRLIDAVSGDTTKTWREAERALHGEEQEDGEGGR